MAPSSVPAGERARGEIERAMVRGELHPGDAIDEKKLAARLGMSRTPVREALLHFATLGFVRFVPRSGVYVAKSDGRELFALVESLSVLEGAAAELAAARLTEAYKRELVAVHSRGVAAVRTSNPRAYGEANRLFHEAIYAGSRNSVIAGQIRLLRRRLAILQRDVFDAPLRIAHSHREHGQILRAITAGDGDSARRNMMAHIAGGGRAFMKLVTSDVPP